MHIPLNIVPQATQNTSLSERSQGLSRENQIQAESITHDKSTETHQAMVRTQESSESNTQDQKQLDTFA